MSPFSEERSDLRSFVAAKAAWDSDGKLKALYPYFESDMWPASEEDELEFIEQLERMGQQEEEEDGNAT